MSKLQQALKSISNELSRFASGQTFWGVLADVFGVGPGQAAAHAIESQLRRGDLRQLARVEVINAAALGPARAAYASANGTIYLSERFVAEASQLQLQAALLEEFGHAIDARVNASDRPGDEGELFSLRVRGITPTEAERQRMLSEDDRRTLTLNGVSLQLEQAAPVVYETTTVAGSGSYYYDSFYLSGLNAAWTEQRKAINLVKFFNGSSTSTIASSAYRSFGDLVISGAAVAYTKSDGQDMEVYRSSGGATTRLTNNTAHEDDLLIDGNTIVWRGFEGDPAGEIYRNNGTSTLRITSNGVREEDIKLSGSNILWTASDGNDYEIYLFNGAITQQLTNNNLDDYSPVLSGNRAAWFQWSNDQENLFFYNGSTTRQVTTNQTVSNPLIVGGNLLYQQQQANGNIWLRLYNGSSRTTSTLTTRLSSGNVQVSGNLVAWLESGSSAGESSSSGSVGYLSSLKLYNGTSTRTIATNILGANDHTFFLRGSKIVYLGQPSDSSDDFRGELFLYDTASSTAGSTQLTVGEAISRYDLEDVQVVEDRILLNVNDDNLKLIQPTTKPILTFSASTFSVVEGFSSPQTATLTVNLSAASSSQVTVRYRPFTNFDDDNYASGGSPPWADYGSSEGIMTFAAGTTSQVINIPIYNDNNAETDETFYVRLSAPTNAVLIPGQNVATVTISDTLRSSTTVTLPANVENLTLTGTANINGTGNARSNTILGNSGKNRLDGGGASDFGSDQLKGGLGDDTYIVSRATSFESLPSITENLNEGIDAVEFSSVNSFDSYTLGSNLETLILAGSAGFSGTGNGLDNVIMGNGGDNFLDGATGIDTVSYADAPGTGGVTASLVFRGSGSATGWGTDILNNFENIIGSNFADTLTGDGSANTLTGNAGKDNLTGNAGSDKFDYRTLSHSLLAGFDRVTDFDASLSGDRFLVSTARGGFFNAGQVTTLLTDDALTATAISSRLTTTNFLPNVAATVTMGSGLTGRTFMVINDAVAGFNAANDAVIEVTGFTGAFGISQFVIS